MTAINPVRIVVVAVILMTTASCTSKETVKSDNRAAAADISANTSAQHANGAPGNIANVPGTKEGAGPQSGGAAGGLRGAIPDEIQFTAAQVQHGGVKWARTVVSTASASATVPGQIEVNEDRTARLGAPARGRVVSVRVSPGARVTSGQALVTLESADAGMAQADVSKAVAEISSRQSQAAYAKSARDRAERLLALKAIPQQDYERAVADDQLAIASLRQAEVELRRARGTAKQMGATASATGEITIRSPISGVVLTRTAIPGSVVDAGAPLITVTDPSSLWLVVNAPEKLSALFHSGQPLRFTVPAFAADTFVARTQAVGAGLDPETRTLPIRGVVVSAGRLKPEMLANVVVVGGDVIRAVVLPDDAVQLLGGVPTVFTATPDGKGGARLTHHAVEVGPRSGGHVAITQGVSPGDIVVTGGAFGIKAEFEKANMPRMEM